MLVSRCENDYIYNAMEACHFTPLLYWYCILNAFKTVYLILMRVVFVNLDCNSQTVEGKPATAIDVGGSAKQTHRHSFIDIVHLMFLENCQNNSK